MQTETLNIKDRRRWLEISAVILTGLGKFIFMDMLNWRLPYITVACLGWLGYVWYRTRQVSGIGAYWGFTTAGFRQSFWRLFPFAVLLVLGFYGLGEVWNTNRLNWGIIPVMLLYPLWGIVQQFLIVGLIGRNLADMDRVKLAYWAVILLTALVFAVVHFPFLLLVWGTFGLALVYTYLYL